MKYIEKHGLPFKPKHKEGYIEKHGKELNAHNRTMAEWEEIMNCEEVRNYRDRIYGYDNERELDEMFKITQQPV